MFQYDNIIRRMWFACWITKATDTHTVCVILLLFHCNSSYANAPGCYVYASITSLVEPDGEFSYLSSACQRYV